MDEEDVYYGRCAGIDVHKRMIVVCLRIGRKQETREFGTLTRELREMTAWLKTNGCQMAAMESTGSYWKPLWNLFEMEELPAMLVNAYHIKNVPGRKTDYNDAQWIAKCLMQGLLRPSFVPARGQREFREMTRFRKSQIEERARNLNRLQKMLEGANIKLGNWVSDVDGKSATELLELVIGKPDFTMEDVATRRHGNLKASAQELFLSLENVITPIQRELFQHVMRIIRQQTEEIAQTNAMIERYMDDTYKAACDAISAIPGIGRVSAQQIIAEIGTDMSRFRSADALCKWQVSARGITRARASEKAARRPTLTKR